MPSPSVSTEPRAGDTIVTVGAALSAGPDGSSRPTRFVPWALNQIAPSAPVVMPVGVAPSPRGISTIAPSRPIRPTASAVLSVNQIAPSAPTVIPFTPAAGVGTGYVVTAPPIVIRTIALEVRAVNQSAPSGPVVIHCGPLAFAGSGNSVIVPSSAIRPIRFAAVSVNQIAPSDPVVTLSGAARGGDRSPLGELSVGSDAADRADASLREPDRAVRAERDAGRRRQVAEVELESSPSIVSRPIRFPLCSLNHIAPSDARAMS